MKPQEQTKNKQEPNLRNLKQTIETICCFQYTGTRQRNHDGDYPQLTGNEVSNKGRKEGNKDRPVP
jgi:hypothetical protein